MAEINVASQLSYGEVAKRTTNDGDVVDIFEAINEVNPVFKFIPTVQCNQHDSHMVNRRTSKGTGTWRKYYKGSAKTATTTQVQYFPTALLEARSEMDCDLINNSNDPPKMRHDEDIGIAQGMQEQVMDAIISGTTAGTPEQIDGLQTYLNSLAQTMVFDGGNSGGTSMYIVDFSPQTCFLTFPAAGAREGAMGLNIDSDPTNSNGKKWATDDDDNEYLVYCTLFKWWVGFVIRDLLAIGRYANINPTIGGSNTFNENFLIEMMNYGRFNPKSTYILCTKELKAQMQIRAKDKGNVNWSTTNALSGEEIVMFGGYAPVMRCDSISTSESVVV